MEIKRKGLMLVLSSPSGAGKTSICKKILEFDSKIVMSTSYTTRPKRRSEKNGVDYFFVSKDEFTYLCEKNASEHLEPRKPGTNERTKCPRNFNRSTPADRTLDEF